MVTANRWMLAIAIMALLVLLVTGTGHAARTADHITPTSAQVVAENFAVTYNGRWSCEQRGTSCRVIAPGIRIYTTQRGSYVHVRMYEWTLRGWQMSSWWQ